MKDILYSIKNTEREEEREESKAYKIIVFLSFDQNYIRHIYTYIFIPIDPIESTHLVT